MKYSYAILIAGAAVLASPLPASPAEGHKSSGHRSECSPSHAETFAIVIAPFVESGLLIIPSVDRLGHHNQARQAISQIADGQIQAPSSSFTQTMPTRPVHKTSHSHGHSSSKTTSDSSKTSSTSKSMSTMPPVSQIGDGQIRAPTSTHSSPLKTSSPSLSLKSPVSQIPDGQVQAPSSQGQSSKTSTTATPSSSTSSHSSPAASLSKSTSTKASTSASASKSTPVQPSTSVASSTSLVVRPPVSQILDGQVQAPSGSSISSSRMSSTSPSPSSSHTASSSDPGSTSKSTSSSTSLSMKPPVTQIPDGQIQAHTSFHHHTTTKHTTLTTTTTSTTSVTVPSTTVSVTQSVAHQPSTSSTIASSTTTSGTAISMHSDGQLQVPTGKPQAWSDIGACDSNSTLKMTLKDGVLKDARGWQGYIASNHQFQFDNPPQAGALTTSGFSICTDGLLALNGSSVFYECLSGDFYNLYDRDIAAQCRPIHLQVAQLVQC